MTDPRSQPNGGVIAIVPARGGSRRIPRKNVIDFFGRPMLAWTIDAARRSGEFDRVVVSTDDPGIAAIGRAHGAEVPFLRTAAFDDCAAVAQATILALCQAETHFGERYRTVVQLMPNCPLRTAADIRGALATFRSRGASFQISAETCGTLYFCSGMGLDGMGRPVPFPQAEAWRNPAARPTLVQPTGAIWIAARDALLEAGDFYGPGYTMELLPWDSAIDIDTAEDLDRARAAWLLRQAKAEGRFATLPADDGLPPNV